MIHENTQSEFMGFEPDTEVQLINYKIKNQTDARHAKRFKDRLIYEFHSKDLTQKEALKQYADHAVKEIKSTYGWSTDVQISIEPEAKDKHLFSVTMSVFGLRQPIVVRKSGKHVMSVMRKVRKSVMRQIHRVSEKKVSYRRKHFLEQQTLCRMAG